MPPKKGKKEKEIPPPVKLQAPAKPKKIPPPPLSFTTEDLIRYKEMFKMHDEDNIEMIPLDLIPLMLRKLGLNPKAAEINELYKRFLEDEFVDTVQYHEWLQMIEQKIIWGDDFETAVTAAIKALGHDDEGTGFVDIEVFQKEIMTWGEPLTDIEFVEWIKLAMKDKTYNQEDGMFRYEKFVDNMNNKDKRFFKEPVNFFKLDQKTLAAMAIKKAQEEKEEQERKDAEKRAREEARRQKLIADGLLPPD